MNSLHSEQRWNHHLADLLLTSSEHIDSKHFQELQRDPSDMTLAYIYELNKSTAKLIMYIWYNSFHNSKPAAGFEVVDQLGSWSEAGNQVITSIHIVL